jgi:ribosomal-protein-alanine N-acetyltransferase
LTTFALPPMKIRPYTPADKNFILDLFRLNAPRYFAPEEELDLIHYLDNETELYFVIEEEGKVIGSGGVNFAEKKTIGKISWDIMHPDYQGKSYGTQLLQYRLDKLKAMKSIKTIIVRTSQVAYTFYQKHGFVLVEVLKDFWAKGFDLYKMEYGGTLKSPG